jgi:hypothetical protein
MVPCVFKYKSFGVSSLIRYIAAAKKSRKGNKENWRGREEKRREGKEERSQKVNEVQNRSWR